MVERVLSLASSDSSVSSLVIRSEATPRPRPENEIIREII